MHYMRSLVGQFTVCSSRLNSLLQIYGDFLPISSPPPMVSLQDRVNVVCVPYLHSSMISHMDSILISLLVHVSQAHEIRLFWPAVSMGGVCASPTLKGIKSGVDPAIPHVLLTTHGSEAVSGCFSPRCACLVLVLR